MALVTFESVAAAAQKLLDEGGKASVRAVIAELGGGSPNAVLPHLNAWKNGRPLVRASDIPLNPEIARLIAEQISSASAIAAKSAEEKASDVQADAEAVAEAGRAAEALAAELEQTLGQAKAEISTTARALENLEAERLRDGQIAQDKINSLQIVLDSERERADLAGQKMAKDEVRLESAMAQIVELKQRLEVLPALEAKLHESTERAAVAESQLAGERTHSADLKQRLETSLVAEAKAREEIEQLRLDAEKSRSAEQTAQAKLESALREMESSRAQLVDVKAELKEAKAEVKEARDEAKELRTKLLETPKAETKRPQA